MKRAARIALVVRIKRILNTQVIYDHDQKMNGRENNDNGCVVILLRKMRGTSKFCAQPCHCCSIFARSEKREVDQSHWEGSN